MGTLGIFCIVFGKDRKPTAKEVVKIVQELLKARFEENEVIFIEKCTAKNWREKASGSLRLVRHLAVFVTQSAPNEVRDASINTWRLDTSKKPLTATSIKRTAS